MLKEKLQSIIDEYPDEVDVDEFLKRSTSCTNWKLQRSRLLVGK
jgi:hypothetical protein